MTVPSLLMPELRKHLRNVDDDGEALIFTGDKGAVLRRSNFRRAVRWKDHTEAVGLREFTFHDLRHTGNTLAAASGASTRELMHRMGHDSVRAALIYQHATSERDLEIADAMNERIRSARGKKKPANKTAKKRARRSKQGDDDGPTGVLVPAG